MKVKYLLVAIILVSIALMSIPAFAGTDVSVKKSESGQSTLSSNPIKETIEQTPSINEMRAHPARPLEYKVDAIGRRVPTQTDNSGRAIR